MVIDDEIADAMARAYWGAAYAKHFRSDKQRQLIRDAMKRAAAAITGEHNEAPEENQAAEVSHTLCVRCGAFVAANWNGAVNDRGDLPDDHGGG